MFYNNEVLTVKNERTYNEKLKQKLVYKSFILYLSFFTKSFIPV